VPAAAGEPQTLRSKSGRCPFDERALLLLSAIPQKQIDQFLIGNIFLRRQFFEVLDDFGFDSYRNLCLEFFAVRILDGIGKIVMFAHFNLFWPNRFASHPGRLFVPKRSE
jgi:hypothetical protein